MPRAKAPTDTDELQQALTQAVERLMAPIARLCLARGVSFAVAEDLLKRAYIDAARATQTGDVGQRDISRVSVATGLTRREVTRITNDITARNVLRPSPATQVFTRWISNRKLHDSKGRAKPLKRQGRAPSFEALSTSVTRDVHPRSVLEELCRLGLARHDPETDLVHCLQDAFAPRGNQPRMLGFLGNNVGDHLAAAVDNVLSDAPAHLEQAIFADELSDESLAKVRKLVNAQWKTLLTALVPELEKAIKADSKSPGDANKRVRIGLYSYHEALDDDAKDD